MLDFKHLSHFISEQISRAPFAMIAITLVITTLCSIGLTHLGIAYGHYSYFDDNHPTIVDYQRTQRAFTSSENIMLVVSTDSKSEIMTPESLNAIEWLTNKSSHLPFVDRVESLTNTQVLSRENGVITISDTITDAIDQAPSHLEDTFEQLSKSPSMRGRLISTNGRTAVVNITLSADAPTNQSYPQAYAAAETLAKTFRGHFPTLNIQVGGYVPLFNAAVYTSIADISLLGPVLLMLIASVLYWVFRHQTAVIGIVVAMIFSVSSTLGLAGWSGMSLNGITAAAPILILTVSMASSVHLVSTYLRKLHFCRSKTTALKSALTLNIRPILITSATTIIGFLSFNLSGVAPFRQLGNIAALGVALSVLYSLTALPAYLLLAGPNHCAKPRRSQAFTNFAQRVTTHPKNTVILSLLIAAALSSFASSNHYNDQFESYFHSSSAFSQSRQAVNNAIGGTDTIEIVISHRDDTKVTDPLVLNQVDAITKWLRSLPKVIHVSSISETIKRLHQEHTGSHLEAYKIPNEAIEIKQLINDYNTHVEPKHSLRSMLDASSSSTRLTLITAPMDAIESTQLDKKISQHINLNHPDLLTKNTSIALSLSHVGAQSSVNMIQAAGLGLLLVSMLLAFMFRSAALGFISIIPNLLPGIVAFGVWGLLVGQLSAGVSAALGIAMGIIVDDTIHFLSYYCAMRDKGASTNRAVFSTIVRIGPIIMTTTMILVVGFLVLSQTMFRLNSDLGYFCALTLSLALLFDLTLLPCTLILVKNYRSRQLTKHRQEKVQQKIANAHDDELILIDSKNFDLNTQNIKIYLQEICAQDHPEDLCNVEVLSRIEDHNGKLLFPRTFLPQLEQLGLLGDYDRVTILKLFDKLDADITRFTRVELFNINVTQTSVLDRSFPNFVAAAAKSRHLQPARLCFEIDCHTWRNYQEQTKLFVRTMRTAGFKLALCIKHENEKQSLKAKTLDTDFLKVDARFIERSLHDAVAAKSLSQLQQHALDKGTMIIAGNVDRKNLKNQVKAAGISIYQGYEIATPVDINWASFIDHPIGNRLVSPS